MEPKVVRFESGGIVRHSRLGECSAYLELIGGRDRHSVGGQIAEGPRWWRGRIVFPQRVRLGFIEAHQHLEVELPNGRAAIGVVRDDPSTSAVFVNVEGRGPPPFEVW